MFLKVACINLILEISQTVSMAGYLKNVDAPRQVPKSNDVRRFRQDAMKFSLSHGPFRKSNPESRVTPHYRYHFNQLQEDYLNDLSSLEREMLLTKITAHPNSVEGHIENPYAESVAPHILQRNAKSKKNKTETRTVPPVYEENLSYYYDSDSFEELKNFRQDFKSLWSAKQAEAKNCSQPPGDVVNMLAARPWGVPCGDPNLHDVPWGTCVTNMECEAESRIFRGDAYCGHTSFVCCAVMLTDQEWDHAINAKDISFEDSGLYTDSQEKRERAPKKLAVRIHRFKHLEEKHVGKKRRRTKKIKKMIRQIMKTMHTLLTRIFKNNTRQRIKAIKKYRKIVATMKAEFKKDKEKTQLLHEGLVRKIDNNMYEALQQIMNTNLNFIKNATFAKIVSERMMTLSEEKMLQEAYPELEEVIRANDVVAAAKMQLEQVVEPNRRSMSPDNFAYDVEYGYLYY